MVNYSFNRVFLYRFDIVILLFFGAILYAFMMLGQQWDQAFTPAVNIDLSVNALPYYAVYSALRGIIAYFISLAFALGVGYWAAKSPTAEKIILPFLDIMQSIPVLGFLPGLVLGLVAIFPHTMIGLELSAILMIFTGQVWNMTFSFYSSLKAVPTDFKEASTMICLSPMQRLLRVELPFSAVDLTWNSVMSMAGGWFFLTVCEAFTLGDQEYRIPGLGSYMAVAIEKNDSHAIVYGIIAMSIVILAIDSLLWRPILAWVHRFRLEDVPGAKPSDPFVLLMIRESSVLNGLQSFFRKVRKKRRLTTFEIPASSPLYPFWNSILKFSKKLTKPFGLIIFVILILLVPWGAFKVVVQFSQIPMSDWLDIVVSTLYTTLRVFGALILGTLWAVPVGIWISQSPRRLDIAQPIIQLLASFPAPMLYPLALGILIHIHNFDIASMFLMLLGVQWYILFNVLAGGLRVPRELKLVSSLMGSGRMATWRHLYIPSVFPSLVTGWVTAAGGAWNASIVAEIIQFHSQTFVARGLGATISQAATHGQFGKLGASLFVMVIVVVALNRTLWAKIYRIAQVRFRMDL